MALLPEQQPPQLLVGLLASCVQRAALSGPTPPPRQYRHVEYQPCAITADPAAASSSRSATASSATCLAVCPYGPQLFAAGHSDGSISLHHLQQSHALRELPAALPAAAAALAWLPARPGCLLALDAAGGLHLLHLLASTSGPTSRASSAVTTVVQPAQGLQCCCLAAVHSEAVAGGDGRASSGQQRPAFMLGLPSGAVQWHVAGQKGQRSGQGAAGSAAALMAALGLAGQPASG
jgi:hypothetical protein